MSKETYPAPKPRLPLSIVASNPQPKGEYGNTLQEYEERIFKAAVCFNVVKFASHSGSQCATVNSFPKALVLAQETERSLIYCVAGDGRAFCIPKKEYGKYALLWMACPRTIPAV